MSAIELIVLIFFYIAFLSYSFFYSSEKNSSYFVYFCIHNHRGCGFTLNKRKRKACVYTVIIG